jgi:hypothetical protein
MSRRPPSRSATCLPRQRPNPARSRQRAALRFGLFALLLLGSLLRPMLILACDIHATAFAHATQPHAHLHAAAAGDEAPSEQGHGDHQQFQLGSAAGAADLVTPFAIEAAPRSIGAIPLKRQVELAACATGAPFRPPIA